MTSLSPFILHALTENWTRGAAGKYITTCAPLSHCDYYFSFAIHLGKKVIILINSFKVAYMDWLSIKHTMSEIYRTSI